MTIQDFAPSKLKLVLTPGQKYGGHVFRGAPFLEQLKVMWNDKGYTVGQCAQELGVNRSVISGLIDRHRAEYGFERRHKSTRGSKMPRAAAELAADVRWGKDRPRRPAGAKGATLKARSAFKQLKAEPQASVPVGQRRTLMTLTLYTCRWPIDSDSDQIGGLIFCGGLACDVPGVNEEMTPSSYCLYHYRMGHRI